MQGSIRTHQIFSFSLTHSFWHLLNTVYCICYHKFLWLLGIQFKSLPLAGKLVWRHYNWSYFIVLFIPKRWHSEGALKVTRRKCPPFSMSWPPGTIRSWLMSRGLCFSPQHRPRQGRGMAHSRALRSKGRAPLSTANTFITSGLFWIVQWFQFH